MLSTIENDIERASNEDNEKEKLIPDFLFNERNKVFFDLPFCQKNQTMCYKFINELNSVTGYKFQFINCYLANQENKELI